MIFARKMPVFYMIIARKIFSRILGGHVPPCPRLLRLCSRKHPECNDLSRWMCAVLTATQWSEWSHWSHYGQCGHIGQSDGCLTTAQTKSEVAVGHTKNSSICGRPGHPRARHPGRRFADSWDGREKFERFSLIPEWDSDGQTITHNVKIACVVLCIPIFNAAAADFLVFLYMWSGVFVG